MAQRMMTQMRCRREAGSRDLRLDNILLDGEGNARLLVKVGMPQGLREGQERPGTWRREMQQPESAALHLHARPRRYCSAAGQLTGVLSSSEMGACCSPCLPACLCCRSCVTLATTSTRSAAKQTPGCPNRELLPTWPLRLC